jgi:hypothetical protein
MFLCRSVAEPQRDLGAQALPSHTRSPDPKVVVDSLADDAGTATPPPGAAEKRTTSPPVVDSKVASPPRAGDTGAGGVDGDVRTLASPRIIDVDPIISRPAGADDDLIKDQVKLTWRRRPRDAWRTRTRFFFIEPEVAATRD